MASKKSARARANAAVLAMFLSLNVMPCLSNPMTLKTLGIYLLHRKAQEPLLALQWSCYGARPLQRRSLDHGK
jgi:hypothetical protein